MAHSSSFSSSMYPPPFWLRCVFYDQTLTTSCALLAYRCRWRRALLGFSSCLGTSPGVGAPLLAIATRISDSTPPPPPFLVVFACDAEFCWCVIGGLLWTRVPGRLWMGGQSEVGNWAPPPSFSCCAADRCLIVHVILFDADGSSSFETIGATCCCCGEGNHGWSAGRHFSAPTLSFQSRP